MELHNITNQKQVGCQLNIQQRALPPTIHKVTDTSYELARWVVWLFAEASTLTNRTRSKTTISIRYKSRQRHLSVN